MEKLQASATNAKVGLEVVTFTVSSTNSVYINQRQTLEALVACFPVYGRAIVLPEAGRFWEALNVEVRAVTPFVPEVG